MESEFKSAIDNIRRVRMTVAEKRSMLGNILGDRDALGPVPIPFYGFSLWLRKYTWALTIGLVLVLTVTGRGFLVTSYRSLPGDPLYDLKTNIIEPAKGLLIFNSEEKAQYQADLSINRLTEAEILAQNGHLAVSMEKQIVDLISKHTSSLVADLNSGGGMSNEKSESIRNNLNAELNAHAKLLETLSTSTQQGTAAAISVAVRERAGELIAPLATTSLGISATGIGSVATSTRTGLSEDSSSISSSSREISSHPDPSPRIRGTDESPNVISAPSQSVTPNLPTPDSVQPVQNSTPTPPIPNFSDDFSDEQNDPAKESENSASDATTSSSTVSISSTSTESALVRASHIAFPDTEFKNDYISRISSVEKSIQSAEDKLPNFEMLKLNSILQNSIVEQAARMLQDSRSYLERSLEHAKEGDYEQSLADLRISQQKTKETGVFIKAGFEAIERSRK